MRKNTRCHRDKVRGDKGKHKRQRKSKTPSRKTAKRVREREIDLTLDGITYCNELEVRIAKLLTKYGIKFEYSKRFDTKDSKGNSVDKDGNKKFREVDFWLPVPIEVFWVDFPLQAIEAKAGGLDERCYFQQQELKNTGVNTWIAVPVYVTFWENYGFLKSRGMHYRGRYRH